MPDYKMPESLIKFAHVGVDNLDGMLNKSAAVLSAMLGYQMKADGQWNGRAFLEIGVYKGKFLALMEYLTRETGAKLIGIDPFELVDQDLQTVERSLAENELEMERVFLHSGYSTDTALVQQAVAGASIALIHVDGSHQADIVYRDLITADRIISNDGYIIADDFFNRNALGVMTAITKFLAEGKSNLEPWALFNTKLVFCRKGRSGEAKSRYLEVLRRNEQLDMVAKFLRNYDSAAPWLTKQSLFGHEILVL